MSPIVQSGAQKHSSRIVAKMELHGQPVVATCWDVPPGDLERGRPSDGSGSHGDHPPRCSLPRSISMLDAQVKMLIAAESAEEVFMHRFNVVSGTALLSNLVYMALATDLAPRGDGAPWIVRPAWFVMDSLFCILFSAEIMLRVRWDGVVWLRHPGNVADTCLVLCMVLDDWILPLASSAFSGLNLFGILRILRLLRLVRVMRVMRAFKAFFQVVLAFKSALRSMFWVCLLMLLGLFIVAIFTTQFIGQSETFADVMMGDITGEERFGTIMRSMFSLFELLTLENWQNVGRPLVTIEPALFLFVFSFIMIFTFGFLNMIVAVVVEKTIMQGKEMERLSAREEQAEMAKHLLRARTMFQNADQDQDGVITFKEFELSLDNNSAVRECMRGMGLPLEDARELFSVLDVRKLGQLSVEDFITGMARAQHAMVTPFDHVAQHASVRSLVEGQAALQAGMTSLVEGQAFLASRLDALARRVDCAVSLAEAPGLPPAGATAVTAFGSGDGGQYRAHCDPDPRAEPAQHEQLTGLRAELAQAKQRIRELEVEAPSSPRVDVR